MFFLVINVGFEGGYIVKKIYVKDIFLFVVVILMFGILENVVKRFFFRDIYF